MQETPIQIGEYSFTILIEPNEPDGYLVTCPALPGLVTEGDTLDDEKISVEELFRRDFDEKELAAKVFEKICQN